MSHLPIVVSLAAMRSRMPTLDHVIASLLGQSVRPDKIIVNVSHTPFLFDEGVDFEDLPERTRRWVMAGDVELYFTENTGPYRKIVPTLRRYGHRPFLLATADDDVIYPQHWLAGLREAMQTRICIAAYRVRAMAFEQGRMLGYTQWPIVNVHPVDQRNIRPDARDMLLFPTGRGGVMYDSRCLPDWRIIMQLRTLAPAQDDLALRFATLLGRIPVTCVHWSRSGAQDWEFPSIGNSGPDLFHALNAQGANDEALQRLVEATSHLLPLPDYLMPKDTETESPAAALARA